MASSTANMARSRSLRIPPAGSSKPLPPALTQHAATSGPSNIKLFLTNLRLLDLDLKDGWPDITAVTLSTKDAKKRIHCVEWALYHLFALWDPEETRNKLQPFFPPLEPLQSLNLRAALFRCLDQAKKNGVLGRDTVLRKTMLDECKGEKLEEILAVFSNAVLEKTLHDGNSGQHQAIAQQLASENFSYSGERTVLSALVLAHKASLSKHLREKNESRARYHDFSELLNLNHRRATRRHEQLKELVEEGGSHSQITGREVADLHERFQKNWTGNSEWCKSILYGDYTESRDGLLTTSFDKVWDHVEDGSIGDVEGMKHVGLLEQLDARVKDQADRLRRWQDFRKTLSNSGRSSPSKEKLPIAIGRKGIDLGFDRHQALQLGRTNPTKISVPTDALPLQDYTRLLDNMKAELENVGKAKAGDNRAARRSLLPNDRRLSTKAPSTTAEEDPPATNEEEWSSASSETDAPSPGFNSYTTKSISQTPPSEAVGADLDSTMITAPETDGLTEKTNMSLSRDLRNMESDDDDETVREASTPRNHPQQPIRFKTAPSRPAPAPSLDPESDLLADQILNSMSAASPSPKKPRQTLSLAERTRLSMSRAIHSQYSNLEDEYDDIPELPRLSIKPNHSQLTKKPIQEEDGGAHADLIERTRKSMAGFEAAKKRAQIERRKSVKDAKKKQRESSYFPKVREEEPSVATGDEEDRLDISVLIEGDPDYESVFKSRPKVKTSPDVSPTKIWEE